MLAPAWTYLLITTTGVATSAAAPAAAALAAYPNPATGPLTVRLPAGTAGTAVEVTLLNSIGQSVRRQWATPAGLELHLSVAGLPAGVYVLQPGLGQQLRRCLVAVRE